MSLGLALGRDGGSLKNLYVPFSLGLGGRLGSGNQWFPWIHVDDVAGIFVHAVENEKVTVGKDISMHANTYLYIYCNGLHA